MWFKHDPGPCPVDDAPHTTCCAPATPPELRVVLLPGRDRVAPARRSVLGVATPATPTTVTTATYGRTPAGRLAREKTR